VIFYPMRSDISIVCFRSFSLVKRAIKVLTKGKHSSVVQVACSSDLSGDSGSFGWIRLGPGTRGEGFCGAADWADRISSAGAVDGHSSRSRRKRKGSGHEYLKLYFG